jgi:NAD(P)-dependent dehydrogenase (short-subunit alcohol dehydrogenase family)
LKALFVMQGSMRCLTEIDVQTVRGELAPAALRHQVAVPIGPSNSLVTRSIGRIADRAITQRGTVWLCPERFGRIDTLISNAGIFIPKPFVDYSLQDFASMTGTLQSPR